MKLHHIPLLAASALATLGASALAADSVTVPFTGGATGGWTGPGGVGGGTNVDFNDGTPAPSFRTVFNNFGITFANETGNWVGDYTHDPFTLSVDVNSRFVNILGMDVTRDLVVELRDYDNVSTTLPYVSVWYDLADITTNSVNGNPGWSNLSVSVTDPTATDLPPGWGGYGDEDPITFAPILPADRTFADVLAGVDEIVFTTLTPGFFFAFTDYDVAIDNPTLSFAPIPEPGTALVGAMLGSLLLRRRQR